MKAQYYAYLCLALLLALGGFDTSWGYYAESSWYTHFTFHFAHASVWHLAGNALCFYVLTRNRFAWAELAIAYGIATLCSFIAPHTLPTIGLSGLIFALYGMRLTRCRLSAEFIVRTAFILLLPLLTGRVNVLLHIFCILVGYCVTLSHYNLNQTMKDAKRFNR